MFTNQRVTNPLNSIFYRILIPSFPSSNGLVSPQTDYLTIIVINLHLNEITMRDSVTACCLTTEETELDFSDDDEFDFSRDPTSVTFAKFKKNSTRRKTIHVDKAWTKEKTMFVEQPERPQSHHAMVPPGRLKPLARAGSHSQMPTPQGSKTPASSTTRVAEHTKQTVQLADTKKRTSSQHMGQNTSFVRQTPYHPQQTTSQGRHVTSQSRHMTSRPELMSQSGLTTKVDNWMLPRGSTTSQAFRNVEIQSPTPSCNCSHRVLSMT